MGASAHLMGHKGLFSQRVRKNDSQNSGNADFNNLIFQNFPGEKTPPPLDSHASGAQTHPCKILPMALHDKI